MPHPPGRKGSAEQLLSTARVSDPKEADALQTRARVHATLAQAAAMWDLIPSLEILLARLSGPVGRSDA
jgi:hypothetical protein